MNFRPLYTILVLLCCITTYRATADPSPPPQAINGILDLRQQPFKQKISLDGQWKFYWHQLINPGDVPKSQPVLVDFPFKWNGYILNGKELPSYGYATYTLTILLPKKSPALRIDLPDVYTAYNLFVNNKKLMQNGTVDTIAKRYHPHWAYHGIDMPRNTDTLKFILQIANFAHSKAGISEHISIGRKEEIELDHQRSSAIDLLLTGCLFMGGMFFLGLYLLGHKENAILLFALFCMVYSYRIIGSDNYVLHTIFPNLSWYLTLRLEYITLFSSIGIFGLYTLYLYPYDVNRKIVYTLNTICFVFAAAVLMLPAYYFTQLVNPFLVIMVFCLIYTPYVYFKAFLKKRTGSIYALMSVCVLMVVFAISLLHYWALIPPLSLVSFCCYILFFFLQSLILSYNVSFHLKKAKRDAEEGLRAKSDFLSTMSHEIRTPLNAVIGVTHLLLKSNPREEQAEYLDVMLFSTNNLLNIVNDVLDYNKIEAGKITFEQIEMDIAMIIRNIAKGMQNTASEKGLEIMVNIDRDLQTKVMGDPTRTTQIISNLVSNAIKFTDTGYIEIGAEVTGLAKHYITLKIWVKDTGIGIAEDKHKLIFERFTQADSSISRSFGGTGLGLSISKKMLELQNSALQLDSKLGEGSTFYFVQRFERPTKSSYKQLYSEISTGDEKPFDGIWILLVDDNQMNIMIAQAYLKKWGASVDTAANGQEALDKLDPHKHRLILLDLHMPVMDGYETAKRIRADGMIIPIIALTANLPSEVAEYAADMGMDDVVGKPFLPDELYNKVHKYVAITEHFEK